MTTTAFTGTSSSAINGGSKLRLSFTGTGNGSETADACMDTFNYADVEKENEIHAKQARELKMKLEAAEKSLSHHREEASDALKSMQEYKHHMKTGKIKENALAGVMALSWISGISSGWVMAKAALTSPLFLGGAIAFAASAAVTALICRHNSNAPDVVEICEKGIENEHERYFQSKDAADSLQWKVDLMRTRLAEAMKKWAEGERKVLDRDLAARPQGDGGVTDMDEYIIIDDTKMKKAPREKA